METASGKARVVIFDLNGTFYNKSSKDEFYKFICTKRPQRISYIFQMGFYKLLKKVNAIRQTEFKENFFNYLDYLQPAQVEGYAREFWEKEYPQHFNQNLIKRFDALKAEGVRLFCATGGLELYVKPLFELYKIDGLAGTKVYYEDNSYLVEGKACKGNEKLQRLAAFFSGKPYTIIEAYSDSKEEMLGKAEKAFLVDNGKISAISREEIR